MSKQTQFDLIVFDWDGTLMNSTGNIARALQSVFQAHGLPEPDYQAARHVIGLSLMEAFQYLAPMLSMKQIPALIETYKTHYQIVANRPILYDGVVEGLTALQDAGYELAIATGKSRAGLDLVLRETALSRYFSVTRTADVTASKPHPQMLNEILAQTGVEKYRALMVGDTTHDLQMACNAGCPAVGMSYGAHDVAALRTCTPLRIFDDFPALSQWLMMK